jgi:hypothetical protein
VVQQILSPGMQHAQETDLRAQMLWIGPRSGPMPRQAVSRLGGDDTQCLRRCPEQDVVDDGLVLERDDLDLLGNGEHNVEVGHVEQFRVTVLEPLSPCETLAFRTVSISARVVRHTLMVAIIASFDVPAESGGAATLDRVHGAPPRGRQRAAMLITESRAEVAEHIRHFQPLAGHGTRPSGGHEVRHRWRGDVECLQGTDRGAHLVGGYHEIPGRGAQIAVTEQQLDGT